MQAHADPAWTRDSSGVGEKMELWSPRVLIADDDADLRFLLAETLRADGYRVIEAGDGEQLLDLVASQMLTSRRSAGILDLIVADVRMPGPSGLWALATLRHMDWALPFVVITAFGDPGTIGEASRLGAAAVLSKPFDLEEFRSAVLNLTGPGSAGGSCGGRGHRRRTRSRWIDDGRSSSREALASALR